MENLLTRLLVNKQYSFLLKILKVYSMYKLEQVIGKHIFSKAYLWILIHHLTNVDSIAMFLLISVIFFQWNWITVIWVDTTILVTVMECIQNWLLTINQVLNMHEIVKFEKSHPFLHRFLHILHGSFILETWWESLEKLHLQIHIKKWW